MKDAINRLTYGDKLRAYIRHPFSGFLFLLVAASALLTFAVLLFLIGYIIGEGRSSFESRIVRVAV